MAPNQRQGLLLLLAASIFTAIAAIIVFGGVLAPFFERRVDLDDYGPPDLSYRFVGFDDLPGWRTDSTGEAVPVFVRSCNAMMARDMDQPANGLENTGRIIGGQSLSGRIADWREACEAAARLDRNQYATQQAWDLAAQAFFETHFRPLKILDRREPLADGKAAGAPPVLSGEGVYTGYFEPLYEASRMRGGRFTAPLHTRPDDLVDVDLGAFRDALSGERIAGRIAGNRLVPYADRKAINEGAIDQQTKVLAWLDPNDLFFLQIQGSGRLVFTDGEEMRVGYDGANGQGYLAIGRVLVQREELSLEEVSMQSIRAWLDRAGPAAARELRETNASYVFFRPLDAPEAGLGPPGAQGLALTPGRSLAVDRRFHAMGAPVYVDIRADEEEGQSIRSGAIRRLMIAQDTGGAIRGPVRGDFFWGAGEDAARRAGEMNATGEMYVLLPQRLASELARIEPSS